MVVLGGQDSYIEHPKGSKLKLEQQNGVGERGACVTGGSVGSNATRKEVAATAESVLHDYTFTTEVQTDGSTTTVSILTMRMRRTGWAAGTPVPQKGAHPHAVHWMVEQLRLGGARPYCIVSDAEASIHALAQAAADTIGRGTITRQAPRGLHESVGCVERWRSTLHDQIRALRMQVETDIGRKNLSRYVAYGDATPQKKLFGRECEVPVVPSYYHGELVVMHDPVAGFEAKHAPRGIDCRSEGSGEHLGAVVAIGEVMRFRSLCRRAVADTHSPSLLRFGALLWKRSAPLLPESVVTETPQDEPSRTSTYTHC
eukprot:4812659-Amphidinium_carterae.1